MPSQCPDMLAALPVAPVRTGAVEDGTRAIVFPTDGDVVPIPTTHAGRDRVIGDLWLAELKPIGQQFPAFTNGVGNFVKFDAKCVVT